MTLLVCLLVVAMAVLILGATGQFPPIVVTAHPQGKFLEGVITGTPLPGSIMQLSTGGSFLFQEGRFAWGSANLATAGLPILINCLQEDDQQGFTSGTAYVAGTRFRSYVPLEGEEMNLLYGTGGGTSNSLTPGQLLMVQQAGPALVNFGSPPELATFMAYDTLTLVAEDTLAWVVRLS